MVTYPDGSTDRVPVRVVVAAPGSQAGAHDPQGRDLDAAQGSQPAAADAIANKADLPKLVGTGAAEERVLASGALASLVLSAALISLARRRLKSSR